jgi:DNA-binding transcriptional ArsR family regulator
MISLRSKTTKKLLSYFFINPHESLYVNELARLLGLDKRNLVKKIRELETEGILISQNRGNMKLYSIDKTYALYDEYRNILMKTESLKIKLLLLVDRERIPWSFPLLQTLCLLIN